MITERYRLIRTDKNIKNHTICYIRPCPRGVFVAGEGHRKPAFSIRCFNLITMIDKTSEMVS